MDAAGLRVNGDPLRPSLKATAQMGSTPRGGVQHLGLSDEDRQARDLFLTWIGDLDLKVTIHEMGNILGTRPGKNNESPAAMIFVPSIGGRSHVDVENTSWEDCEAGANVLLGCLLESAMERQSSLRSRLSHPPGWPVGWHRPSRRSCVLLPCHEF